MELPIIVWRNWKPKGNCGARLKFRASELLVNKLKLVAVWYLC